MSKIVKSKGRVIVILEYSSSHVNSTKTSDSSAAADESPQEANETSVVDDTQNSDRQEVNRKSNRVSEKPQTEVSSTIAWTTSRTMIETTKETKRTSTEMAMAEKNIFWETKATVFQETSTSTTVRNDPMGRVAKF